MKQIKFSKTLERKAEIKANEEGLTFNEYIRHLVVNDTSAYIEVATPKLAKELESSLRDIDEGRYTILNNKEEIRNHINSLLPSNAKRKK